MIFCATVIAASIIALVVGRFAGVIGTTLGLLDHPDSAEGRKRHVRVTPLVGGIAVSTAAVSTCLILALFEPSLNSYTIHHLLWLAGTVAAMFVLGATDDRFSLGPLMRIAAVITILAPVVIYAPGFQIGFLAFNGEQQLSLSAIYAVGFTVLCLLALLNAVNMADGKNGIVITMSLIWSVLLMVRLPVGMLPVTGAVAAALTVLLWFNMRNRLFLGDSGSYVVSTFFGLLAIYAYNHNASPRAEDVALMFAIPIFDTARLIVVRSLQRQSPFKGGRDHLHHYLFARVGWPRGLLIFITLVAFPNFAALLLPGTTLLWALLSAFAYALTIIWAQGLRLVTSHLRLVPATGELRSISNERIVANGRLPLSKIDDQRSPMLKQQAR